MPRTGARAVRSAAPVGGEELEELVHAYRHTRSEHARAGAASSARRALERRLHRIERRFERLLEEAVEDTDVQAAWRAHLVGGAAAPEAPSSSPPPLVFKGRSASGSVAELRRRVDGDYDVRIDGALTERLAAARDVGERRTGVELRLGRLVFREVYDASRGALDALRRFVAEPGARPPYEHAAELLADGLVDRELSVTSRGQRALGTPRPGGTGVPAVEVVVQGDVGARVRASVERKLARLVRRVPLPVLAVRVVLSEERNPSLERPALARAELDVDGRIVRAHAAAATAGGAVELLEQRLARRLATLGRRRDAGRRAPSPPPGEWRHGSAPTRHSDWFPRPPEERQLIRRATYARAPSSTAAAVEAMRLLDHDFYLFTDEATGDEALVRRWPEGGRAPLVVGAGTAPVLLHTDAIARLDLTDEPFLFFVDAVTRRGCVLYRRRDGHYGLIEPAGGCEGGVRCESTR